jgi:hypothetical protein
LWMTKAVFGVKTRQERPGCWPGPDDGSEILGIIVPCNTRGIVLLEAFHLLSYHKTFNITFVFGRVQGDPKALFARNTATASTKLQRFPWHGRVD